MPATATLVDGADLGYTKVMRGCMLCLILTTSAVLSLSALSEQAKPTCAVLTFDARAGITTDEAGALSDRFAAELTALGALQVMTRDKMTEILQMQDFARSCAVAECAIEAGRLLAIQYVVFGSISRVGETYSVVANLANVESGVTERSAVYDAPGRIDDLLLRGMAAVALKLSGVGGGAAAPEAAPPLGPAVGADVAGEPAMARLDNMGAGAQIDGVVRRPAKSTRTVVVDRSRCDGGLLIVLDCSESMTAWKLHAVKACVKDEIRGLARTTTFNLAALGDSWTTCFDGCRYAESSNIDAALQYIDGLRSQGNAGLNDILEFVLAASNAAVGIVSDWIPSADSRDIHLERRSGRIFGIGLGRRVSRLLMESVTDESRVALNEEDYCGTVHWLFTSLRREVEAAKPLGEMAGLGSAESPSITMDGASLDDKLREKDGTLLLDGRKALLVFADGDIALSGDSFQVELVSGAVQTVRATGHVRLRKADDTATSGSASYEVNTGELVLRGTPVVTRSKDKLSGDEIILWRDSNRVKVSTRAKLILDPP